MKSLDEGFLRVKGYLCRQKNLAVDRCPKEIINTLSLKKKREGGEGGEGKTGIWNKSEMGTLNLSPKLSTKKPEQVRKPCNPTENILLEKPLINNLGSQRTSFEAFS